MKPGLFVFRPYSEILYIHFEKFRSHLLWQLTGIREIWLARQSQAIYHAGRNIPGNTFDEQWKYGFTKSANRNRQYRNKAASSSVVWSACLPSSNLRLALRQQYWTDIRSPAQPSGFCGCFDNIFAVRWAGAPPDRHHPFRTWQGRNLSALAETFLFFIT